MGRIVTGQNLALWLGGRQIFSSVDLELEDGASVGIVGPNGSGKTSLIKVLVGQLEPTAGAVSVSDNLRIGYVPQSTGAGADHSLREDVLSAFDELRAIEKELEYGARDVELALGKERASADLHYASLLERFEMLGGYDYRNRMAEVTARLGLAPPTLDTPAYLASGGERTRAALAKALLSEPDLLVMDEPTNYLDFDGLAWLEGFLKRYRHAFLVVSHDRYFLDQVTSEIWEVEDERLQRYRGNYSKYKTTKAAQADYQQKEYERQQEYIAKQESFIQRYHAGQRSREARGRAKKLERLTRLDAPKVERSIAIPEVVVGRTGDVVLSSPGMEVGFDNSKEQARLLAVPELQVALGSRIAVLGRNGSGKTTLLRTLLGLVPPLAGSARLGHNVKVGYYRQAQDDLPERSDVLHALLQAKPVLVEEARSYLARFLFRGDDIAKPVAGLSGGERSRLALARLLILEPNVLVLDEPTTHLDIPSREALEQVLLAYSGTMILVSHDRRFVASLAEELWLLEDGNLRIFAGTYGDFVNSRQQPVTTRVQTKQRTSQRTTSSPAPIASDARPDHEATIRELEATLQEIENGLEAASRDQDIEEVVRLGQQHREIELRLETAWLEWAGQ